MASVLRIGCSGWSYKDWRGLVYPTGLPQRLWLDHYQQLKCVLVSYSESKLGFF